MAADEGGLEPDVGDDGAVDVAEGNAGHAVADADGADAADVLTVAPVHQTASGTSAEQRAFPRDSVCEGKDEMSGCLCRGNGGKPCDCPYHCLRSQ